jgi:hypothetical protein
MSVGRNLGQTSRVMFLSSQLALGLPNPNPNLTRAELQKIFIPEVGVKGMVVVVVVVIWRLFDYKRGRGRMGTKTHTLYLQHEMSPQTKFPVVFVPA